MKSFPRCPVDLPDELHEAVLQFAVAWANSPVRPRVRPAVERHWMNLTWRWADNNALPLFIRKKSGGARGKVVKHRTGRQIIPCDNSPAVWAFTCALRGERPSLRKIEEIYPYIPAEFTKLGSFSELYDAGWKLAHIDQVGLKTRDPLKWIPLEQLKTHFLKLMNPVNMFVVPKQWAGLGELREIIEAVKDIRTPNSRE